MQMEVQRLLSDRNELREKENLHNRAALKQITRPITERMNQCKRYSQETARLRSYIIAWVRELELGGEELRAMQMEQHGPAGRALMLETWRVLMAYKRKRPSIAH